MTIGTFLIFIAFLTTLVSLVSFYRSPDDRGKLFHLGKQTFYGTQLLLTVSGVLLLYYLLTNQFQYGYVYGYSSRDLPFFYLVSSLWAGQEGSFLLWTLFIVWFGWWFIRTNQVYTALSMVFVNGVLLFFLAMLLKKTPFTLLQPVPVDGAGLNPLLQDPWMVIHPPLLFLGYAAVIFPFSLAMSALIKGEYNDWARYAQPWVVVVVLFLGAGIIVGGYWAYKVLGWGGYWGWDPVENSSLIPWIVSLILLHGLIIQRVRGGLKKTNLLAALVAMLLVVYATFLTRSGVLGDFSVHSFGDLGLNGYLIVFLVSIVTGGGYWFFRRYREIDAEEIESFPLNRTNTLAWSLSILAASAVLTLIGTSSPIITRFYTEPSSVSTSFYNQVHLPIGILMSLFLGLSPLMTWRGNNWSFVRSKFIYSLLLTIISGTVAFWLGVTDLGPLVFLTSAFFALFINGFAFYLNAKMNWTIVSGPLAHIGVALMLIGIIISSVYETKQQINLLAGSGKTAFGYEMNFRGAVPQTNGKDEVAIEVITPEQKKLVANPQLYYSQYNRGVMKSPYILRNLLYDVYISPIGMEEVRNPANIVTLKKSETVHYEKYRFVFEAFDMSPHQNNDGGVRVGAKIKVVDGKQSYRVNLAFLMTSDGRIEESVPLPGSGMSLTMVGMNVETKSVNIRINDPDKPVESGKILSVEISKKPLINLLWIGTVLLLSGCVIGIKRRTEKLD